MEIRFAWNKRAEPKYLRHLKSPVTLRLDPHVIEYFKRLSTKTGLPYQSLINYDLKDYAKWKLEPSSAWHKIAKKTDAA
ncbi:MAG: BrnA antitoxin family protein [Myxococcales bacterium]|nr:BrnA antitoxin family protein [Myxococcales bacterium]